MDAQRGSVLAGVFTEDGKYKLLLHIWGLSPNSCMEEFTKCKGNYRRQQANRNITHHRLLC